MKNDELAVPKNSYADAAQMALTAAVTTGVALVGAAHGIIIPGSGELLNFLLNPSIARRRDKWMQHVSEVILQLQQSQISIESLASNEEFLTFLMQASQIAVKTHVEEKREFLANALLNYTRMDIGYDSASVYLDIIDRLQPAHIRIISLIDQGIGPRNHVFKKDFIAFLSTQFTPPIEEYILDAFCNELEQMGIVPINDHPGFALLDTPYYVIAPLGKGLLDFITSTKTS